MNEKLNKTNNQSAVFGVKTAIALILIAFMLLSSLVYGLGLLISPLNANGPHSTQQLGNHHETVTTGRTPQAPANFRLFGQENGRPVLAWWSCNYAQWSSMRWRSSDGRSGVLHSRIGTSTIRVDGPMLPNVSYTFYVRGYNSANLRGPETSITISQNRTPRNVRIPPANIGALNATVQWDAPIFTTGITGYQVRVYRGFDRVFTSANLVASARSFAINGLWANAEHRVVVVPIFNGTLDVTTAAATFRTNVATTNQDRYGNHALRNGWVWMYDLSPNSGTDFMRYISSLWRCTRGRSSQHSGIDVRSPRNSGIVHYGMPIRSASNGTVVWSNWMSGGPGYTVAVRTHDTVQGQSPVTGRPITVRYAHLQPNGRPAQNSTAIAGQTRIGFNGNSGTTSGTHVHFDVNTNMISSLGAGTAGRINPLWLFPGVFPELIITTTNRCAINGVCQPLRP